MRDDSHSAAFKKTAPKPEVTQVSESDSARQHLNAAGKKTSAVKKLKCAIFHTGERIMTFRSSKIVFSLLAFGVSAAIVTASPVNAGWFDCQNLLKIFAKSGSGSRHRYKEILQTIQHPPSWLTNWDDTAIRNLSYDAAGCPNLTEKERSNALKTLTESSLLPEAKYFLAVFLLDDRALTRKFSENDWDELAFKPFSGYATGRNDDAWKALFEKLPVHLKQKFDLELSKNYATAEKFKIATDGPYEIAYPAGKRFLDGYLRLTAKVDLHFLSAFKNGVSSRAAYAAALKEQKQSYFRNTSVGEYSEDLVFEIALAAQRALVATEGHTLTDEIVLSGSFVNGKAILGKSDIDANWTRPIPTLQKEIAAVFMKKVGPGQALEVEECPIPEWRTLLNPFSIHIRKNRIDLRVAPVKTYSDVQLINNKAEQERIPSIIGTSYRIDSP